MTSRAEKLPDFDRMAAEVVTAAEGFVTRAVRGITGRVDDLFAKLAAMDARVSAEVAAAVKAGVEAIPRPKDGCSVTLDDLRPLIASETAAAMALLPKGWRFADGPVDLVGVVSAEVERAVAAIPRPKDGESVHPDSVRLMVLEAVAKEMAIIPRPQDGQKGDSGRDALLIEPLPAINIEKSYPRGTWANHARGLWMARAQTDGMQGWDCVVAGVADIHIESDDERAITVRTVLSDGKTESRTFSMPFVRDRGVFREGEKYAKGDGVTWAGSYWIAQKDTEAKPDSADGSWRLAVKKGRDAK